MSYISANYHIVFATYQRQPTIPPEYEGRLYGVISEEVARHGCKLLAINGVQDHLHLLVDLNPTVALSNLMRDVKSCSSVWIRKSGLFPLFQGWEKQYGAFAISYGLREAVINYINGQKEHHAGLRLDDEYDRLIMKAGLTKYQPPKQR